MAPGDLKIVTEIDSARKLLTSCLMPPTREVPEWRYETVLWDVENGRQLNMWVFGPANTGAQLACMGNHLRYVEEHGIRK